MTNMFEMNVDNQFLIINFNELNNMKTKIQEQNINPTF
jgi:hypothetical protein